MHHTAAVSALRAKLKPRLLNAVKGDNSQTLVGSCLPRKSNAQSLDIWAGTWNMGECDPPYNLEEWVPNSFDLIAVGVEECMSIHKDGSALQNSPSSKCAPPASSAAISTPSRRKSAARARRSVSTGISR